MSGLSDVDRFIELARQATRSSGEPFFDPSRPVIVTRAPGRLDVMGGIADYSGGTVFEITIAEAALVGIQLAGGDQVAVRSEDVDGHGLDPEVVVPVGEIARTGPEALESVGAILRADPRRSWAGYVLGAYTVLAVEKGVRFDRGARILLGSQVPLGKGVSSSAAIEVASFRAIASAYGVPVGEEEVPVLTQMVENRVVGAPCGIMDQMTANLGESGTALPITCQPHTAHEPVRIPDGIEFVGIDSGIRHAVGGSDYAGVRIGAFMGYRMIAEIRGFPVRPAGRPGLVHVDDDEFHGYLARIPPSLYEADFRSRLPERMRGSEFLGRYGGTTDPITRIDPDREYAVRTATEHPIYETHRVRLFTEILRAQKSDPRPERLEILGEIMYQAHESYTRCGVGSDGTDDLVRRARAAGPAKSVYGAKITGGGSGGVVAVLIRSDAFPVVERMAEEYARSRGIAPLVLRGTSPGAREFGARVIEPGLRGPVRSS